MKIDTEYRGVSCDDGFVERPRYFPRQPITANDMTLEQDYFRNKLRRHNRLMHGWGVVCGAEVCRVVSEDGKSTEPWKVVIKPGYVLGPYGDEIMIDCARCFDLRTRCITGMTGESCVERVDPWCSEVYRKPESSGELFVAVRYKEAMTRPVRVHPAGCGCDETQCDYSRWHDGYEICVLDKCPDSHLGDPPSFDPRRGDGLPACPECPSEPWVVLAKVKVDDNGIVESIDHCHCRRTVVSFAHYWWRCKSMRVHEVKNNTLETGGSYEVLIRGEYFVEGTTVTTDTDEIEIVETLWEGEDQLKVIMKLAEGMRPAKYKLNIGSPDGGFLSIRDAVTVIRKVEKRTDAAARGRGGTLRRPARKKKAAPKKP